MRPPAMAPEEIDELLPEELADDPALDDLLADLDSTGAEIFEEPDLALVQSTENADELGEFELGGELSGKISDPVRAYLREIGTASLLTREGEIDLARRMERGQARVKKALSRAPLVIQEMLELGEALEQDRVSVQDVLIMPASNGIDNSGTEEKEQLLQRIAEIAKHYEKAQQFHQQLQAVSRRLKPKQHRMLRYNFARSLVRLSRIYRQIQFTPQFQRMLADLVGQAVEQYKPAEREIAKIQRRLEESVLAWSAGLQDELRASLRQLTQHLRQLERTGDGAPRTQAHPSDHRARPARNRDGQEAAHRSKPPAGGVDRQAIQQPWPAFSGSDPGRQHRSDEGGRQIRLPARLQVLHLCDVVDPAGDHTGHCRAGADHPDSGPHGPTISKLVHAQRQLRQELRREPTLGELARRMEMSASECGRSCGSHRNRSHWKPPWGGNGIASAATSWTREEFALRVDY